MIEVKLSYHPDPARATADCRFWAALALPAEIKQGVDDPVELERLAEEHAELAPSRFIVTADPDEAVERVGAYVEMGFDHLVFHSPAAEQAEFVDRFARDLAPRLRERFA
jgi:coenzyme F420-dependent glucose-6-phosphate dehydrogenase